MSATSISKEKAPGGATPRASRVYQLTSRKADMSSIANQAPMASNIITHQDSINRSVAHVRGVVTALCVGDSFTLMAPEQVAACMDLIHSKLNEIEQHSESLVNAIC